MIAFFPNRYPDELLYSTISRYKELAGFPTRQAFLESLYNKRLATNSIQFPLHIERLISNMPPLSTLTAKDVIEENTLFPYYTAFMSEERTEKIYNTMLGYNSQSVDSLIGILSWNVGSYKYLRYCKSCLEEDISTYGESYWRRMHQIPGALICPKHQEVLQESSLLANNMRRDYVPLDYSVCNSKCIEKSYSHEIIQLNLEFIKNVQVFLSNKYPKREIEFFRKYYISQLQTKGLAGESGIINHRQLVKGFQEYYSPEYLEHMQCVIDDTKENTWLHLITRSTKKNKNPLHHLLLIQFLDIDIDTMFNSPEVEIKKRIQKRHIPSLNIKEQREKWLKIIEHNPGYNRKELKSQGVNLYNWIVKYDREWYEIVTPKNSRNTIRLNTRLYDRTDEELLEIVKVAVHNLRFSTKKPTRITELAIKREAGITSNLKNPLFKRTYYYIQENVEDLKDFRRRKIKWAIREMIDAGMELSPYKIECKVGFGSRYYKEIRPLVEEILSEYKILKS